MRNNDDLARAAHAAECAETRTLSDDEIRAVHRQQREARAASMTDEQRAETAYPNTTFGEPAPEAEPDAANEAAKKFYPSMQDKPQQGLPDDAVPENIRALRAEDRERAQFGAQSTHADTITPSDLTLSEGAEGEQLPQKVREQTAHELREIWVDLGLSNADSKQLVQLAKAGLPDDATSAQWQQQTTKRLLDLNGQDPAKAARDLELAQRLVQRDPRVAQMLDITGLGNHPKVVEMFIGAARGQNLKGRLPPKKK